LRLYEFCDSASEERVTKGCSVWKEHQELKNPAARLNQKVYAKDWLENLIISATKYHFRHHNNPL